MFETTNFRFDHVMAIICDASVLLDQLTNKERMSELSGEDLHKVTLGLQILADRVDDLLEELRGWKAPEGMPDHD